MKLMKNIVLLGFAVLLLSSCASQDEIRKLNYQIRSVNQKLEDVKTNTVNKLQKRQASSVNKIDAMTSENEQLRALIEESEHKSGLLREKNTQDLVALTSVVEQMRTENEQRLQALETKLAQMGGVLEKMQTARVQAATQRAQAAARRAEEARKRSRAAAAASAPVVSSSFVVVHPSGRKTRVKRGAGNHAATQAPAQTQIPDSPVAEENNSEPVENTPTVAGTPFDQGMASFKAGQYKKAYKTFEQLLSGNPRGKTAAQTLFYMGECLYNQGEFDLAILDYQKVISNHAQDPHTPSALLKQGMSFEKLTDLETAKIIFHKLIEDYPDSSEAGLAKKRLGNL